MKITRFGFYFITISFVVNVILAGCKKEEEKPPNKPPVCAITSPAAGQQFIQGETVIVSAKVSDSDGSIAEVQFYVDDIGMGAANTFPYKYEWSTGNATPGQHVINVVGLDNSGASASAEVTIVIIDLDSVTPVAGFGADKTEIFPGTEVQFTDLSTHNPDTWEWDFGDGNTSTEQNPVHAYSETGTYTVTLTVTNSYGESTETKNGYITVATTGTFTDPRDGKTYNTVMIGEQVWMAENLSYASENSKVYNNNAMYEELFGRLYSIDEALTECPDGWHLPTDDEWIELEMFLGMSWEDAHSTDYRGTDEGKKLKSVDHWLDGGGGTDEVGFSALPGGRFDGYVSFEQLGIMANFWTATYYTGIMYYVRKLSGEEYGIWRGYGGQQFYSVRCVRNNQNKH